MNARTISVITVAWNAEATIEKTIISVINQTYKPIEYIFIDGKSTDGTNDIINRYRDEITLRNIAFKHVSEKDTGIYNAMNKGLELACGEWIYFLNADDRLYDDYVFEKVFCNSIKYEKIDCIYGNVIHCHGDIFVKKRGAPIETIFYKYPICHQAAFVKRNTLMKYRFNEEYKRLADFNQFFSMYLDGKNFEYMDIYIAFFSLLGVSQSNYLDLMFEREKVHLKLGIAKRKRIIRWSRYLFIYIIKTNGILYRFYLKLNERIQQK